MKNHPKAMLDRCETLMLDMDGTLLDLAFDNYMWLHHVPERYADRHSIPLDQARAELYARFRQLRGTLDWYCLDHWSDTLGLDILGLHRDENHRIGYLPGAEDFLADVRQRDIRVLLVTNSHEDTLTVKDEVTGVRDHFDRVYTSHEFGHPKEDQPFWQALRVEEGFDPSTTLFVDDNHDVLESAANFGIEMLVAVTRPDTSEPARDSRHYAGVEAVAELV
ncbi:MAG: GMP/IMP nucleotidase [Woeseiaceae bacterium]|nr:GMP/IMP nucleotidase [Woeseiaceae bacterium]